MRLPLSLCAHGRPMVCLAFINLMFAEIEVVRQLVILAVGLFVKHAVRFR